MEPVKQPVLPPQACIVGSSDHHLDDDNEINPYFGKPSLPLIKAELLEGTYDEEAESQKFKQAVE